MPRYFFNIEDSVSVKDYVGQLHDNDEAAYLAALKASPDLLRTSFKLAGKASDDWRLEVVGEDGRLVATTRFRGLFSPSGALNRTIV